jgi:hypothetical protein
MMVNPYDDSRLMLARSKTFAALPGNIIDSVLTPPLEATQLFVRC